MKTKMLRHLLVDSVGGDVVDDDDDDYAKQPDNTFKAVCSRIRPLMREFLHTHVTPREHCFQRVIAWCSPEWRERTRQIFCVLRAMRRACFYDERSDAMLHQIAQERRLIMLNHQLRFHACGTSEPATFAFTKSSPVHRQL
ncbi:hypothetical protein DBV15_00844 [Temnothorax longispinosus]|uniref:Uncharacterized protein n=1 Tax=Temnothorax longispinosus TaxID=300112 RepID=A0A4V3SAR3_9HYME|nr:hypothetical protein DBV15_00844 [Temnothorax longispinosus]